jgi:hypothetical protein
MPRFFYVALTAILTMMLSHTAYSEEKSLVERLGYPADARLLIVNADDFGMNHATNVGTIKAFKAGGISSATIMFTCPWFLDAVEFAKENPKASCGVHTVLTSEWGGYKWGPVLGQTTTPSLVDNLGHFYPDVMPLYMNATPQEAEKEVRAQIDRALEAGLDVTHIDSHMGAMQYAPAYHEVYLKIAKDYNLPCRVAGRELMAEMKSEYLVDMADEMGLLHPDYLHMGGPEKLEETETYWKKVLSELPEGKVSELYIHCGQMTPEMRATTATAAQRTEDTEWFSKPETQAWLKDQGITMISYRELRHLQREGEPMEKVSYDAWE